ncbi:DUF4190 domain-containing protein [Halobacillus andaensis]|uniref:DUF4190 domain-containing protein n=1 Tax=Halobacillus andaensis TaxID=1176239 RepID=UPI003D73A273
MKLDNSDEGMVVDFKDICSLVDGGHYLRGVIHNKSILKKGGYFMETNQTSTHSILSLTLGVLAILIPFIGIGTGIAGVVLSKKASTEIRKTNQGGKGMAVSGMILSIAGIILQLLVLLSIITFMMLIDAG